MKDTRAKGTPEPDDSGALRTLEIAGDRDHVDEATTIEMRSPWDELLGDTEDVGASLLAADEDTDPSMEWDPDEAQDPRVVGATLTVVAGPEAGRLFLVDGEPRLLGRGDEADFAFGEATVSRHHARLTLRDGRFWVEDLGSTNGTFLDGVRVLASTPMNDVCRLRIGRKTVLQLIAMDRHHAEAARQISRALVIDRVTGTRNRASLDRRLDEEVSFALRHRTSLGLLMVDLDGFKAINDRFGHPAGDRMLRKVGRLMMETVRLEDSVFRYGGDEFCLIVRGVDQEGLRRIAERLRSSVERSACLSESADARVTASVGVATVDHDVPDSDEQLLRRADRALYEAKSRGRNRVVMPGELDA